MDMTVIVQIQSEMIPNASEDLFLRGLEEQYTSLSCTSSTARGKAVQSYDLSSHRPIHTYPSARAVSAALGIPSAHVSVSKVCCGFSPSFRGLGWRFVDRTTGAGRDEASGTDEGNSLWAGAGTGTRTGAGAGAGAEAGAVAIVGGPVATGSESHETDASVNEREEDIEGDREGEIDRCGDEDGPSKRVKLSKSHLVACYRPNNFSPSAPPLQVFRSAAEAARHVRISPVCMSLALRGKSKTAAGYIWKYISQHSPGQQIS